MYAAMAAADGYGDKAWSIPDSSVSDWSTAGGDRGTFFNPVWLGDLVRQIRRTPVGFVRRAARPLHSRTHQVLDASEIRLDASHLPISHPLDDLEEGQDS